MRPTTLLRLALAGSRTDAARVALTAVSAVLATLAVLSALTVLAIQPATSADCAVPQDPDGNPATMRLDCANGYAEQYTNALLVEPGLRPGVAFALLMLCVPVLALAGQSARFGAPARDRRLAALRLAGAAPRQAVSIAVAETGLAAALGAGLGVAVYFAGRALLHRPDAAGQLPLPTDQHPPPVGLAATLVGLPLLAAVATALLLRRVAYTPFGVVRRHRTAPPRPWPGVLIVLGVGAFAAVAPLVQYAGRTEAALPVWVVPSLLAGGGLLAMLGVVLGTAWISYLTGRVLRRLARRPAALLAGRRLLADPWTGSRTLAALLACVMVGAGAAGVRAWFAASAAATRDREQAYAAARGEEYLGESRDDFYFGSLDLVDAAVLVALVLAALGLVVFLVEGIVSRRRAYSALVATGVPRGTLARTIGWQALAPAVPAIGLALAVGVALPRSVMSGEQRSGGDTVQVCTTDWEQCEQPGSPYLRTVEIPEFVHPVGIPVLDLATVGGVALVAVAATVGIGLLFLRPSTDVTELRTT